MSDRRAIPETRLERLARFSYELARYGGRKLVRDRAPVLAAALAYRTIFSIVPVLVLAMVVVRAFSSSDDIKAALYGVFGWFGLDELVLDDGGAGGAPLVEGVGAATPVGEVFVAGDGAADVPEMLSEWVNNAVERLQTLNYGAVTVVGLAVFVYAALSLLVQIEAAFNVVCRAPAGRGLVSRLTNYWTLLTLGSVGVVAAFAAGRSVNAALSDMPVWLAGAGPVIRIGIGVATGWIILLFAYTRMPNARVRLRPAAIGALVGAGLWVVARGALGWFVDLSTEGQVSVYGSLALVPMVLLWIYVTWLIVLFGLEVATSLQAVGTTTLREREAELSRGPLLIDPGVGVLVMREVAAAFEKGETRDLDQLSEATGVSDAALEPLMEALGGAGLARRIEGEDRPSWTLSRPADQVALDAVLRAAQSVAVEGGGEEASGALAWLRDRQARGVEGLTLASPVGA